MSIQCFTFDKVFFTSCYFCLQACIRDTTKREAIETRRTISEEELQQELQQIKQAQQDLKHFQVLYDKYFATMFRFIYRRTDDEDITADLTSQTFFAALRHIKKFKYKGVPFSAWLYRIASNEVLNYYRSKKRRQVFSLEEEVVQRLVVGEEPAGAQSPQLALLVAAMKKLSERDVEAIQLRYFEERTFEEMGYILEIGEATAKMRTYRAVERLKEMIKGAT
jgi:RNA polymerase sigma-70 factor (ECF subfamily)